MYKPDHYSSISPYLYVDGAAATIEFLVNAFGATEVRRFTDDKGGIVHAEVRLDDSIIMLTDAKPGWPATAAHVYVYVPDVDDAYRRALAAGATSLQEPVQQGDADKRGGIRDAGGTTWWIATLVG
jgi:uncharacterized glyoxalase superfamily protein PhnB